MGIRSGNSFSFLCSFCCHFSFAFLLLEMALSVALLAQKQAENAGCVYTGGVNQWSLCWRVGAELEGGGSGTAQCIRVLLSRYLVVSRRVQTLPGAPSVIFVQLAALGLASSKGPVCV